MSSSEINVSIIVPCRNERDNIEAFFNAVFAQTYKKERIEIIVADGLSDDGTRELLENIAKKNIQIRIVDNKERTTPYALNHAIRAAKGDMIIRMDVHTDYAPDYIQKCLDMLELSGADNVGGPWQAVGMGYLQTAIALAFQSPFSSGNASSHRPDYEGEVDSVYLGCWKKSTLMKYMFDEEFVRNQDDELNLRIIRSGGRIWQSPQIQSWYRPRASLFALFKQYMQYGYWKVRVIRKHKIPASIRHLIPGGYLLLLALLLFSSVFFKIAFAAFLLLLSAYAAINFVAVAITCLKPSYVKYLPVMPFIFSAYHFGYGYGFLKGVTDVILSRNTTDNKFIDLTR